MCALICAAIKASTGTVEEIFMLREVKENKNCKKRQKEIRKVVKECGLDLKKRSGKGVWWQQLNADASVQRSVKDGSPKRVLRKSRRKGLRSTPIIT